MIVELNPIPVSTDACELEQYYSNEAMADLGDAGGDYPARDLERYLSEAARLIDIHDDGSSVYYESLDPDVIGRWVFGDEWDSPKPYDAHNVILLRDILARHCDTMRCASSYANDSFDETWHLITDGAAFGLSGFAERQLAIDGLRYPGLHSATRALIERRRYRTHLLRHGSGRAAQNSRITPADWPGIFERTDATIESETYRRFLHHELPEKVQALIHEGFVLVVDSAPMTDEEQLALTEPSFTQFFGIDVAGTPTTCLAFAKGLLRIPLFANRALMSDIRSHLVVAYVFDDHALLVEYPWCGMTAKARIAAAESLEVRASKNSAVVPVRPDEDSLPCKFVVNHVQGLPTGQLDVWADEIPF